MNRPEIIKALQMDVEIPEVVQERAMDAFDKIRAMSGREENVESGKENVKENAKENGKGHEKENGEREKEMERKKAIYDKESVKGKVSREAKGKRASTGNREQIHRKRRFSGKKIAVIFLAATLACASITTAAAYLHWSRSIEEGMQVTEEQKVQLEEEHAVAFAMQECTKQGVTITAEQSITDNYFAYIVFRIEGYELAAGAEPAFEWMRITVDGKDDFNYTASFYDGLIVGLDGRAANADGSPLVEDEYGNIGHIVMEDGSMEYVITLGSAVKGYFVGKDIHVELENLGTVAKAAYLGSDIEDIWTFDWNLQGKDTMKEYSMQETLGDTGAVVKSAELSPVSIHVEYDFPMQMVTEEGFNENGEAITAEFFADPPMISGVKMKDGTLIPWLTGGGSMGYDSENTDTYRATFSFDRVIDVEQVESLLFMKSYESGIPTEENFYVVPLP